MNSKIKSLSNCFFTLIGISLVLPSCTSEYKYEAQDDELMFDQEKGQYYYFNAEKGHFQSWGLEGAYSRKWNEELKEFYDPSELTWNANEKEYFDHNEKTWNSELKEYYDHTTYYFDGEKYMKKPQSHN